MDPTFAIILALFLLLFFGTTCFSLYVWLKKSLYTREKFAFAGLATASALTLFVITSILAQEPPWLAAIGLIRQLCGLPYQMPRPLTGEQEILSILLVVGLLVAYQKYPQSLEWCPEYGPLRAAAKTTSAQPDS